MELLTSADIPAVHGHAKIREVSRDVNLFLEKRHFKLAAIKQKELIQGLKMNDRPFKSELQDLVRILLHGSRPDEALEVRSNPCSSVLALLCSNSCTFKVIEELIALDPQSRGLVPIRAILLHSIRHTEEAKLILAALLNERVKGEEFPSKEVALLERALSEFPAGGLEVISHTILDVKKASLHADPKDGVRRNSPIQTEAPPLQAPKEPNLPDQSRPAKPLIGQANPEIPVGKTKTKNVDLNAGALATTTIRQKLQIRKKKQKGGFSVLAELEGEDPDSAMKSPLTPSKKPAASPSKSLVGGNRLRSWAEAAKVEHASDLGDEFPALNSSPGSLPAGDRTLQPQRQTDPVVPVPEAEPSHSSVFLGPRQIASALRDASVEGKCPRPRANLAPALAFPPPVLRNPAMSAEANSAQLWKSLALDAQQRLGLIEGEMGRVIGLFDNVRAESEAKSAVDLARAESVSRELRTKLSRLQMANNVLGSFLKSQIDSLVPEEFFCPISLEMMRDPVTTTSGQCYERAAIQAALCSRPEDPMTRGPCTVADLRPNLALKTAIDSWTRNRESMRVVLRTAAWYANLSEATRSSSGKSAAAAASSSDFSRTPGASLAEPGLE